MTPMQCLAYVAVHARWSASVTEVAEAINVSHVAAYMVLEVLVSRQKLHRIGDGCYRTWVSVPKRTGSGSLGASENTLSKERVFGESDLRSGIPSEILSDHRLAAQARARQSIGITPLRTIAVTRKSLLDAEEHVSDPAEWTARGIAGRFIRRWEALFGIEYKPAVSYSRDVWCAEQILAAEGELAVWVVEALFDKQLAWLTGKSLEFAANQSHRNRHLRQVAVQLVGKYQPARAAGQVVEAAVHIPGGRR